MRKIILIAHNLRSAHNVGSLLRTADGLGVDKVYLTGYTPYPVVAGDQRLPHLTRKTHNQISKTALGAENTVRLQHTEDVFRVITQLKQKDFLICALEQHKNSVSLPDFKSPHKIALIVGREVEGLESEVLKAVDKILEIPMRGKKESFNVAAVAAMALYQLTYIS